MDNAFTDRHSKIARLGGIGGVLFALGLYGFSVWHGDPTLSAGGWILRGDLLLMLCASIAFYVAGRQKRRGYEALALGLFGVYFLMVGIPRLLMGTSSHWASIVDFIMSGVVYALFGAGVMFAAALVYAGREDLLFE